MMRIETVSDRKWGTPERMNIFDRSGGWNAEGAHHLSTAEFDRKLIVALDGKQEGRPINRLREPIFHLLGG